MKEKKDFSEWYIDNKKENINFNMGFIAFIYIINSCIALCISSRYFFYVLGGFIILLIVRKLMLVSIKLPDWDMANDSDVSTFVLHYNNYKEYLDNYDLSVKQAARAKKIYSRIK